MRRMKMHAKRMKSFIILFLIIGIVTTASSANGEHDSWDCPGCDRTGNTGNYCGKCAHPAPWLSSCFFMDANAEELFLGMVNDGKKWTESTAPQTLSELPMYPKQLIRLFDRIVQTDITIRKSSKNNEYILDTEIVNIFTGENELYPENKQFRIYVRGRETYDVACLNGQYTFNVTDASFDPDGDIQEIGFYIHFWDDTWYEQLGLFIDDFHTSKERITMELLLDKGKYSVNWGRTTSTWSDLSHRCLYITFFEENEKGSGIPFCELFYDPKTEKLESFVKY